MKFDDLIKLKALQLKATHSGQTTTEAMESHFERPEVVEAFKLRQVCAMVSPQLFQELEGTCELLGISKRKFVEVCLIDGMNRAGAIVSEVDPFQGGN
jgi:hypothetical protein